MEKKTQHQLETVQVNRPAQKRQPLWETRVGAFQISIWERKREIGGRTVPVRNVALTKRYKDRDGEFQSATCYLMENEVHKAIVALHAALSKLAYNDFETEQEGAH